MRRYFWIFFLSVGVSTFAVAAPLPLEKVSLTLKNIDLIMNQHYALRKWKAERGRWDHRRELGAIYQQARSGKLKTAAELRASVAAALARAGDLHLGLAADSTLSSRAGVRLRSYRGPDGRVRVYVAAIEPEAGIRGELKIGDEVLAIDGLDPESAYRRLGFDPRAPNPTARLRRVDRHIVEQSGFTGHPVSVEPLRLKTTHGVIDVPRVSTREGIPERPFGLAARGAEKSSTRRGYLPAFGAAPFFPEPKSQYLAYTFEHRAVTYGYLRIPSFESNQPRAAILELQNLISHFEGRASGLVIDLTGNPGGLISFAHAFSALLLKTSIPALRFQRRLNADDVRRAWIASEYAKNVKDDAMARAFFGPDVNGYPITFEVARTLGIEGALIRQSWENRSFVTPPISIDGVAEVTPFPNSPVHFTKPIVLLTDATTASAAEFITAELRDSGRAHVIGIGGRTAGAGGTVREIRFPNPFGIRHLSVTESFALRKDGRMIEEYGVDPNEVYEERSGDLTDGYRRLQTLVLERLSSAGGPATPSSRK